VPFDLNLLQSSQQEPAHAKDVLDDGEGALARMAALGILGLRLLMLRFSRSALISRLQPASSATGFQPVVK